MLCKWVETAGVGGILQGLRKDLQECRRFQEFDDGGPSIEEQEPDVPWRAQYWDEITGRPELVQKARLAEIEYMHKLAVHEEATARTR